MESKESLILPVLPLRNVVLFPQMVVPLFIGRRKSLKAVEKAVAGDKRLFLVAQRRPVEENPDKKGLYNFGTICSVMQLLKLPDNTDKALIEGHQRAKVLRYEDTKNELLVHLEVIEEAKSVAEQNEDIRSMRRVTLKQFEQFIKLDKRLPQEMFTVISQIKDSSQLLDNVAQHVSLSMEAKQKVLSARSLKKRFEILLVALEAEIGSLKVDNKIRGRVRNQMEKTQREYYLNEQLKAIQKELGSAKHGLDDLEVLEEKIKCTPLTKEAREKAVQELRKLRQMSLMSSEATVGRNYLDWLLSIPWKSKKAKSITVKSAEKSIENDHYGLREVKERIIEYLAVLKRKKSPMGSILCLVGPPGVGKTSLGASIAKVMGKNFVRVSLGGMRDEAEIRGHRKTYIGAMPGKILQSLRKAKANNPFFLLDEIDKMGSDFRGDPAAALLEVLDPEQNKSFMDYYLEIEYDLSKVVFMCTANTMNIPIPLLDRMEIIRIPGYTEGEKKQIAKRYLLEKQEKLHGLEPQEWRVSDAVLLEIIRYYTREAGVRELERQIAKIARKSVKKMLVDKRRKKVSITKRNLASFLGVKPYLRGEIEKEDLVGVCTALAWTEVGGELLSVEALCMKGKGKLHITGKLGEVMKESITASMAFVKAKYKTFGIDFKKFQDDIHLHVPEGAIPKDGPSAGIAMVVTLISVLTNNPVSRYVAMTGEMTLKGRILAVGGLKEKLLAATRGGLKTVFIPKDNEKDLKEVDKEIKDKLTIIPVGRVEEVLGKSLKNPLKPSQWKDEAVKGLPKTQESLEEASVVH